MMLLWAIAGVPLGAYNISEDFNIALRIQPQILTTLSLITWGQCFYYDDVRISNLYLTGHKLIILIEMDREEMFCSRLRDGAHFRRNRSWIGVCPESRC